MHVCAELLTRLRIEAFKMVHCAMDKIGSLENKKASRITRSTGISQPWPERDTIILYSALITQRRVHPVCTGVFLWEWQYS